MCFRNHDWQRSSFSNSPGVSMESSLTKQSCDLSFANRFCWTFMTIRFGALKKYQTEFILPDSELIRNLHYFVLSTKGHLHFPDEFRGRLSLNGRGENMTQYKTRSTTFKQGWMFNLILLCLENSRLCIQTKVIIQFPVKILYTIISLESLPSHIFVACSKVS